MKYLWSDTHFGHTAILRFQPNRGFSSVEQMNESMIAMWNSSVRSEDEIYFLGDFSFEKEPRLTFDRLNGHKHLILGNHDESRAAVTNLPWQSISHLKIIKEEGIRVVACHYPLESWPNAHKGYLHAHGHSHGSLKRVVAHRFDVGVDVFPAPISVQELATLSDAQAFEPSDHHA